MRDEHVTAAAEPIEYNDQTIEVYPLSDKDLDSLSLWVRYKINKNAREEAQFAENALEKKQILSTAAELATNEFWFSSKGINLILNDSAGLEHVAFLMCKRQYKQESFKGQFGSGTKYSDNQLSNRTNFQNAFLKQNTMTDDSDPEPESQPTSSKTKKKSVKK